MIYFINNKTNPQYSLALEEVLIKSDIKENILLLWQNDNTVVIGRNQNAYGEIKIAAAEADKVNLARRQSGGGAVFQDLGNMCFSFIVDANQPHSYKEMCKPIIKTLNRLGVHAEFEGKNDIKVGGKKISGNAQYLYKDRLLHHGTILFDVDITRIINYLTVDRTKLISKGIASTRSAVTNIKDLFDDKDMTIAKLKHEIMRDLIKDKVNVKDIPADVDKAAEDLAAKKYDTWEWKFGVFPEFAYSKKERFFDKGSVEVLANITNGLIDSIKFFGDFVGNFGTTTLEEKLKGVRYVEAEVAKVITDNEVHRVFGANFTAQEIINLIMNIVINKKKG